VRLSCFLQFLPLSHGSSFVFLVFTSVPPVKTKNPTAAHFMRACGSHRASCLSLFLRTDQRQKYRQTLVASNSHKRFSYLKPLFVPPLLHPLSPARTANCKEKLQLLSQRWLKAVFPTHAVKKVAGKENHRIKKSCGNI
jgi:hypothetical protein